jgi:YD repeat-containing protein
MAACWLADLSGNALIWNSLSQLEKFGSGETYSYDAVGRLTTVTSGAGGPSSSTED